MLRRPVPERKPGTGMPVEHNSVFECFWFWCHGKHHAINLLEAGGVNFFLFSRRDERIFYVRMKGDYRKKK
jgi:hypothetical protein